MKKNVLWMLAAGALLLTACKKDPVEQPVQPTVNKLEKVSMEGNELSLAYNSDGSIRAITLSDDLITGGGPNTYTVAYGVGNKISSLTSTDGHRIVPFYVGNQLTHSEVRLPAGSLASVIEYGWQGGKLATAWVKIPQVGAAPDLRLFKFEFTQSATGNITESRYYLPHPVTGNWQLAGSTRFAHDANRNPLLPVADFMLLLLQPVSANNILQERHYDGVNTLEETVSYAFTYNAAQLPSRATVTIRATGQAEVVKQLLFTYR